MRKKILSFALALALCLGLAVPVFADGAPGDTTVTDANGITYQLSSQIIAVERQVEVDMFGISTCDVYVLPEGTTVVPLCPDGYVIDQYWFVDSNGQSIRFDNFNIMGIGNVGLDGMTVDDPDPENYGGKPGDKYYNGIVSYLPNGSEATLVFVAGEEQPGTEQNPVQPEKALAKAGDQEIEIDGRKVAFQTYMLADENGNGTNYVKLRDIAHVLNGTPAQFSVGYNRQEQSITATTGAAYKDTGTEMDTPFAGADKEYVRSMLTIVVDGAPVQLDAITLMDDAGNGYNYFKLRDLGEVLGFNVGYSRSRGVFIETGKAG